MNETPLPAPPPAPPAPSDQDVTPQPAGLSWIARWSARVTRREFILRAGWAFFWVWLGGWTLATLRYMFPNVLYEPSASFKAGFPDEYEAGTVSNKWKKGQRVWVVRQHDGFYAVWARCTHLGCTPSWFTSENRFKCPCHGSNFSRGGDVVAGPAPRPLYRVAISLAGDGQLFIDKAIKENRPGLREKAPYFLTFPV